MRFTKLSEAKNYFNTASNLKIPEVQEIINIRDRLFKEGREFEANFLIVEIYKDIIKKRNEVMISEKN